MPNLKCGDQYRLKLSMSEVAASSNTQVRGQRVLAERSNTFIEGTPSGLRPPVAPHVER
jgi:hypothetical protein